MCPMFCFVFCFLHKMYFQGAGWLIGVPCIITKKLGQTEETEDAHNNSSNSITSVLMLTSVEILRSVNVDSDFVTAVGIVEEV